MILNIIIFKNIYYKFLQIFYVFHLAIKFVVTRINFKKPRVFQMFLKILILQYFYKKPILIFNENLFEIL